MCVYRWLWVVGHGDNEEEGKDENRAETRPDHLVSLAGMEGVATALREGVEMGEGSMGYFSTARDSMSSWTSTNILP